MNENPPVTESIISGNYIRRNELLTVVDLLINTLTSLETPSAGLYAANELNVLLQLLGIARRVTFSSLQQPLFETAHTVQ